MLAERAQLEVDDLLAHWLELHRMRDGEPRRLFLEDDLRLAVEVGALLDVGRVLGLPAGIIAAVRRNSIFDHGVMGISLTGYSMPIFWWGLLAILFFSNTLHWTPVSGRISVQYYIEPVTGFLLIDSWRSGEPGAFQSALSHLILPVIVLGTQPLAVIARMTRSAMLEVLGEDYIRTARAKGLPPRWVIGAHALRNALIPVVTVIGLQVGVIFTGACVMTDLPRSPCSTRPM